MGKDDFNKYIEQLERCSFTDKTGHPLENNVAFIQIKSLGRSCECLEPPPDNKPDETIIMCGRCSKIVNHPK